MFLSRTTWWLIAFGMPECRWVPLFVWQSGSRKDSEASLSCCKFWHVAWLSECSQDWRQTHSDGWFPLLFQAAHSTGLFRASAYTVEMLASSSRAFPDRANSHPPSKNFLSRTELSELDQLLCNFREKSKWESETKTHFHHILPVFSTVTDVFTGNDINK